MKKLLVITFIVNLLIHSELKITTVGAYGSTTIPPSCCLDAVTILNGDDKRPVKIIIANNAIRIPDILIRM